MFQTFIHKNHSQNLEDLKELKFYVRTKDYNETNHKCGKLIWHSFWVRLVWFRRQLTTLHEAAYLKPSCKLEIKRDVKHSNQFYNTEKLVVNGGQPSRSQSKIEQPAHNRWFIWMKPTSMTGSLWFNILHWIANKRGELNCHLFSIRRVFSPGFTLQGGSSIHEQFLTARVEWSCVPLTRVSLVIAIWISFPLTELLSCLFRRVVFNFNRFPPRYDDR